MLPSEFWFDLAGLLEKAIRGLLLLVALGWTPLTAIALARIWVLRRRAARRAAPATVRVTSLR